MITGLVQLVIYIMVLGLVTWLLLFLIDYIPLPEPFNRIAKVVIVVVAVVILIVALLGLVGDGPGIRIR